MFSGSESAVLMTNFTASWSVILVDQLRQCVFFASMDAITVFICFIEVFCSPVIEVFYSPDFVILSYICMISVGKQI